jgi:predicted nucleic acid-binding protein
VQSREKADFLTPQPNLQTRQDQMRHERAQLKLSIAEDDEHRMAEWRRLHPKDVAGEEAFWAEKKAARRERRARKRFLEAELNNPNSMLDIDENSPEWDDL